MKALGWASEKLIGGVVTILLLIGCGGGSSGTGVRTFDGRILTTQNDPLSGATVTVVQTGDSTVTDAQGFFSLDSEDTKSSVDFAIDASDVHTVVNVATIDPSSTSISLNVKVDKVKNSAQVQIVDVRAQIVGTCDPAFENNEVIRQANKIAKGTICTVRVKVFGDGHPLVGEKIALQRHSCASDAAPWTTITEGNI